MSGVTKFWIVMAVLTAGRGIAAAIADEWVIAVDCVALVAAYALLASYRYDLDCLRSAVRRVLEAPKIERVRMALAEVGVGPEAAWIEPEADGYLSITIDDSVVPRPVAWRAFESTLTGPCCFACWTAENEVYDECGAMPFSACRADRPFEQDCGVSR